MRKRNRAWARTDAAPLGAKINTERARLFASPKSFGSVAALAKHIGAQPDTMANVINGTISVPSSELLRKISKALGVPLKELTALVGGEPHRDCASCGAPLG